eukprot:217686-Alexandrium_andersonii.AAC.1
MGAAPPVRTWAETACRRLQLPLGPGSLRRPGVGPRTRAVRQARLRTRCLTPGQHGTGGVGLSR